MTTSSFRLCEPATSPALASIPLALPDLQISGGSSSGYPAGRVREARVRRRRRRRQEGMGVGTERGRGEGVGRRGRGAALAWVGAPFLCCLARRAAAASWGQCACSPTHSSSPPRGIFRQLSPPHMRTPLCRPFPLVFFCFGATRLASILLLLLLPPLRLLLLSLNILPSLALIHGVR